MLLDGRQNVVLVGVDEESLLTVIGKLGLYNPAVDLPLTGLTSWPRVLRYAANVIKKGFKVNSEMDLEDFYSANYKDVTGYISALDVAKFLSSSIKRLYHHCEKQYDNNVKGRRLAREDFFENIKEKVENMKSAKVTAAVTGGDMSVEVFSSFRPEVSTKIGLEYMETLSLDSSDDEDDKDEKTKKNETNVKLEKVEFSESGSAADVTNPQQYHESHNQLASKQPPKNRPRIIISRNTSVSPLQTTNTLNIPASRSIPGNGPLVNRAEVDALRANYTDFLLAQRQAYSRAQQWKQLQQSRKRKQRTDDGGPSKRMSPNLIPVPNPFAPTQDSNPFTPAARLIPAQPAAAAALPTSQASEDVLVISDSEEEEETAAVPGPFNQAVVTVEQLSKSGGRPVTVVLREPGNKIQDIPAFPPARVTRVESGDWRSRPSAELARTAAAQLVEDLLERSVLSSSLERETPKEQEASLLQACDDFSQAVTIEDCSDDDEEAITPPLELKDKVANSSIEETANRLEEGQENNFVEISPFVDETVNDTDQSDRSEAIPDEDVEDLLGDTDDEEESDVTPSETSSESPDANSIDDNSDHFDDNLYETEDEEGVVKNKTTEEDDKMEEVGETREGEEPRNVNEAEKIEETESEESEESEEMNDCEELEEMRESEVNKESSAADDVEQPRSTAMAAGKTVGEDDGLAPQKRAIQQQLVLLLHAQTCPGCLLQHCREMKTVLAHLQLCSASHCTTLHCSSAR